MPATAFPPRRLLAEIKAHAGHWFPELGTEVRASVVKAVVRPQSALAFIELSSAGHRRTVLAKAPFPDGAARTPPAARPRLGLSSGYEHKHDWEWTGLVAAWDTFGGGEVPGVGAVRPLLHDQDAGTLVIEHVAAPTLRAILDVRQDAERATAAVEHAGRWLAGFRSAVPAAGLVSLRGTPADVVAQAGAFGAFLHGNRRGRALAVATEAAFGRLAGSFPLGAGHGDFAPRNIFVEADATVRVIDPLARLSVPHHEDVAYLLLELRLGGLPLRRHRDDTVLRAALLRGANVRDDATLAAFEGLVLLDKWAAASVATRSLRNRVRLWRIERLGSELTGLLLR